MNTSPPEAAEPGATPDAVRDNIEAIVSLEELQTDARSLSDRISDTIAAFAGTVLFVLVHLAAFGAWTVVNLGKVPGVPAFDPYPFNLLTMVVSMEAVLLSSFVLIKQNRMSARADRRNHLDLQINLLAEQEITKVIQMLGRIGAHIGLDAPMDAEARELAKETAVGDLALRLDRTIPVE